MSDANQPKVELFVKVKRFQVQKATASNYTHKVTRRDLSAGVYFTASLSYLIPSACLGALLLQDDYTSPAAP